MQERRSLSQSDKLVSTTTTSTWIRSPLVKAKTHETAAHKSHTDPVEGAKAAAAAMTVARMASFMVNTSADRNKNNTVSTWY